MLSRSSAFRGDLVSYIRRPNHWPRALLAAAGGYAAALAAWEFAHLPALQAFIFGNELLLDARRSLAAGLFAGAAVGLLFWIFLGFLQPERLTAEQRWDRAASLVALGLVLPFLPVLAIPGIAIRAPFLVAACVALPVVIVVLVVRSLRTSSARGTATQAIAAAPPPEFAAKPTPWIDRTGLALAFGMAACYAVVMTALVIARHNSYLTNAFDLGIHDQSIYNILHSGYMRTTLYGTYARDYIGDHFSPALYLLAPIYALREDARTLLALQTLLLAAAAIPLYLLARLKAGSAWIALALVAAYLLHPALHGANLDDFHQIALFPLFLLSALYFLETDRIIPFLVFLALALGVKEEVALTVVAVGAYVFFAKRRYRLGIAVIVVSLVYFVAVSAWIMPRLGGAPQIDTRFGNYIAPGTSGASGAAWTLLTNPWFTAIQVFGNPQKLTFLLQVFLPVIFLPLLAAPAAWIVALPALAIQTLTAANTQYDINYHYTAHLLPLVFFLAALGLGRFRGGRTTRRTVALGVVGIALVVSALAVSYVYSSAFGAVRAGWPEQVAHDRVVDEFVAQIPQDASVSTLGGIVPHLSARKTIYLFPDVADAQFLLLDTGLNANYWPYEGLKARDKSLVSMAQQVRSGAFGLVRAADGVYLFERGRDPRDNQAALMQMLSTRYEAEILRSDFTGSVVSDAGASGGKASRVTPEQRPPDGKAAVTYGPYTDLQPGNYRATFVLKATGVPADARFLTVDIFTHNDGYPRAVREIYGRDLSAQDSYQSFAVEFNTSGQTLEDVEFRAIYDFVGEVSVDRVELAYLP